MMPWDCMDFPSYLFLHHSRRLIRGNEPETALLRCVQSVWLSMSVYVKHFLANSSRVNVGRLPVLWGCSLNSFVGELSSARSLIRIG